VNNLICSKFNIIILQKIIIYQSELTKNLAIYYHHQLYCFIGAI